MNCPKCNHSKTGVIKTWHEDDLKTVYRRRECPECHAQFETAESARILSIQSTFDIMAGSLRDARSYLKLALAEMDTIEAQRKIGQTVS